MGRIIKPLLVFFREHSTTSDFDSNIRKLTEYDRLVFLNMQTWQSWAAAKRFVTRHRYADGFYTHVVLIDDDIVFDIDTLDMMLQRIKTYNYPVISADAIEQKTKRHYYQNKKIIPPSKLREDRTITFGDGSELDDGAPIFKVSWTRCQLMIIRSDLVVNTLSFRNDSIYNGLTDSEGLDHSTVIANELWDNNIPQYLDSYAQVEIKPDSEIGAYYTTDQWNAYFARKDTDLNIWQINMVPLVF